MSAAIDLHELRARISQQVINEMFRAFGVRPRSRRPRPLSPIAIAELLHHTERRDSTIVFGTNRTPRACIMAALGGYLTKTEHRRIESWAKTVDALRTAKAKANQQW